MTSRNQIVKFLLASFLFCVAEKANSQSLNARNDLFPVLLNTCSNHLDATSNDDLDSLPITQLLIITQPQTGSASRNGNFLTYCPAQGFLGADFFKYAVTAGGLTDTATVFINILPPNIQNFPGDADQNGTVEYFDVLAIGLAYNLSGPARDSSFYSLAWSPVQYINNDPGAADCNGDGIIDSSDVLTVEGNYGNTYSVPNPYVVDTSVCNTNGIPFYIETLSSDSIMDGDTLLVSLRLGDGNLQNEAYGIAFTLEFDNRFIPGNLVQFQTANSWLLQDEPGLIFKKDFQSSGEIDVALTKTNHNPASENGEIARVILPIDDNIDGIAIGPGWHDLRLGLRQVRLINEYDIARPVCIEQPAIRVYKIVSSVYPLTKSSIRVYPNPSDGNLKIEGNHIESMEITDITGKKSLTISLNEVQEVNIDLKNFTSGVYLLTVKTEEAVYVNKIFIRH